MRAKGEVQWKEKRGFVLSPGPSRVERRAQSQRHSVRDDKPVSAPPPMRPDRPKGLTLSMFGNQKDRLGSTAREGDRTIKRKPVPSAIHDDKDRERKTLSTATTIVGSPKSPRLLKRHSHQPAEAGPSSSNNPPTIYRARAASEVRPVPPPSSMYSRTQGIRPTQPKNIFGTQSIVRPGNPTEPDIGEEDFSHSRIPSTQLTHWSDFRGSDVPAQSTQHLYSAINPPSAPRHTNKIQAIGRKVAAGEYEWWNSDYSDSEDEKVVVPSIARYRGKNDGGEDEEMSNSDYEGDEDDEDIRQRYLDEHEALLRMVQGVQQKVPRTSDYLNTLPERPVENTVTQMRTGSRAQHAGLLSPTVSAGYRSTIRRERSVRR
ncbi:MAG: hypothetical protein Q9171_006118 [Xanthocarpia ochracea]